MSESITRGKGRILTGGKNSISKIKSMTVHEEGLEISFTKREAGSCTVHGGT